MRNLGGSAYIDGALASPLNIGAYTFSVWASHANLTTAACALGAARADDGAGVDERSLSVYFRGDTVGDPVQNRDVHRGGGVSIGTANSAASYVANTLYHIATSASGSTVNVYLNGTKTSAAFTVGSVSNTTVPNRFSLGDLYNVSGAVNGDKLTGDVAMAAFWDVALTDAEIASLAKGFATRRIRPQALVLCMPLVREIITLRGGMTLTDHSSTVVAHPRSYGF